MANPFLDIAPLTRTVQVRGKAVTVHGASLAFVVGRIMAETDLVKAGLAGALDPVALVAALTRSLPELIAAGVGMAGDTETIVSAADLTIGEQWDLAEAIVALTAPEGFGPFVERLERLLAQVEAVKGASGPAVPPPKPGGKRVPPKPSKR